jgi:hypothetical protein
MAGAGFHEVGFTVSVGVVAPACCDTEMDCEALLHTVETVIMPLLKVGDEFTGATILNVFMPLPRAKESQSKPLVTFAVQLAFDVIVTS